MPPEQDPESPLKQIRTFQGDVAEALKKQQESLVSIQRREHIKSSPAEAPADIAAREKRKQFLFLFLGSLILFVLGVAGAWYGYQEFVRKTVAPILAGPANRFIAPTNTVEIELSNLSREILVNNLANATRYVPAGELRHIVMRKVGTSTGATLLSSSAFLENLDTDAPGTLLRALDPLFMFGVIGESSTTTSASTFLIIKLSSFENAYAGMLTWEKSLALDIGPLFASAPLLINLPMGTTFADLTDRNKDIRVLEFAGEPVLLYSFFENQMLIITDRIETMRILVERLTREKLSR